VNFLVRVVLRAGSPRQIVQSVICLDTVQVPTFHVLWARANERFKDKAVDKYIFRLFVGDRTETETPVALGMKTRLQLFPVGSYPLDAPDAQCTPDAAVTTDAVAGKVRYCTVLDARNRRLTCNHDTLLIQQGLLGQSRLGAANAKTARFIVAGTLFGQTVSDG
jgi:hypothetical protein